MLRRFALILASIAVFVTPAAALEANEIEIVHIRVGQGDATLIRGPANAQGQRVAILFDAGNLTRPDGGALIIEALLARNIAELDYFIVSHDDADHIGGAAAGGAHGSSFLLGPDQAVGAPGDDDGDGAVDWVNSARFIQPDRQEIGRGDDIRVRNFVDYGDEWMRATGAIEKYQAMAAAQGRRITLNTQADVDSFEIDLGGGVRMILMAANGFVRGRNAPVDQVNTPNERSLSFLLRYGGFDYLISGDMIGRAAGAENAPVERAVGQALTAMGVHVDVLHVDHHGADNGSEATFLEAIRPEVAIISAGNANDHGHPTLGALRRLEAAGVRRIVQTEWGSTRGAIPTNIRAVQAIYQDDIVLTSDGNTYEISTRTRFSVDQ